MLTRYWGAAAVTAILAITGCSTKVGQGPVSQGSNLTAVITPIGHARDTGSCSASVCITVRSGQNVILSGKDSINNGAAITSFDWTQTGGATLPTPPDSGAIIYHSANTISFRAPQVAPGATPLAFKFTIANSVGQTSTATASVTVLAANDPDQFLGPLATRHHFVVAVASTVAPPASSNPPSPSIPVCVTVTRVLTYPPADSSLGPQTLTLKKLTADGSWSAALGGVANSFTAYQNPRVTFEIPAIDQDDITSLTNAPGGSVGAQPVPSAVDAIKLQLTASAEPGSCDGSAPASLPTGATLLVQVQDSNGTAVAPGAASVAFTPDMLAAAESGIYETADTARAYYDAIDPSGSNTSLSKWLANNCFDPSQPNYGATAHSVYTNNYDLGFGRDMYFVTCTASTVGRSPGRQVGDSASVVINYPSLEAAVLKQQPIIAVAMEYNAPSGGGRRFPKFYVFAPNTIDGTFQRVLSANFDGRGEKYVPGSCVMCHGGTLPTLPANFVHACTAPQQCAADQAYVAVADPTKTNPTLAPGDIDAGFMLWDVDSLLFSNNDPAFTGVNVSPNGYRQTDQEASLKLLNQLAYCTMQPEMDKLTVGGQTKIVDRFLAVRQLVSHWYGGSDSAPADSACATSGSPTASLLPNSSYDDKDSTPALWTGQTAPNAAATPSTTSDALYHQVLARHCRACHVVDAKIDDQFADYPSFINYFQPQKNGDPGVGLQYIFQQARMPLARLTTDRLWVDGAATILAKHVQQINGTADPVDAGLLDASGNAVGPGRPVINITLNPGDPLASPGARYVGALAGAFGPAPSFFVSNASWTLALTSGGTSSSPPLVSGVSGAPAFATDSTGTYQLTLHADNGLGGSASASAPWQVNPTRPKYTAANCPGTINAPVSTPTALNLAPAGIGINPAGCIVLGDGLNTVQFQDPATLAWLPAMPLPVTGVSGSLGGGGATWSAQVTGDQAAGSPFDKIGGYALSFTYSSTPANPVTLLYRVSDVDGLCPTGSLATNDCSTGSVTFNFTRTLANLTLAVNTPPAFDSNGNYQATFLTGFSYAIPEATLLQGLPSSEITAFNVSAATANIGGSGSTSLSYAYPGSNPIRCDVNGTDLNSNVTCGSESFDYTATGPNNLTVTGSNSQPAVVTIQTLATTSFSQSTPATSSLPAESGGIYAMLTAGTTNCSTGCHNGGDATAASNWQYQSDAATTYNGNPSAVPAEPGLGQWVTKQTDGSPATTPDQSAIYQNGCIHSNTVGATHTLQTQHFGNTTDPACKYVLQWLAEGGNLK